MPDISCEPISPQRLEDYSRFFDTRAFTDNPRWAGCHCYYPLHDPHEKQWSMRTGEENRAAARGCIAGGRAHGWLAYAGAEVVGWCNAGPARAYPMLREGLPPDADRLGAILCFVVAPSWRRRGVATTLLGAACDGLRALGMKAVQARALESSSSPAENHLGPLAMYRAAGFDVVGREEDGTVRVRKVLAAGGGS